MKLLFLDNNYKTNYGSHRIYIRYLMDWLLELGYDVEYNLSNYNNYDVIICDKAFPTKKLFEIREASNALIGIANTIKPDIKYYDFVISACQSERAYALKFNPNIVIFPQIEKYSKYKQHQMSKNIVICYHGNLEHLEQLDSDIINALEELSKEFNIVLKAIYDIKKLGLWKRRRPNINIIDTQWDINTIEDEILSCDIGFVPNNSSISNFERKIFYFIQKIFNRHNVGHSHDYLIRCKPTSNAGRAFVFHQLGIPVVSEMYPDAYHILQSRNCGYIAKCKESWITSFKRLIVNYKLREDMAKNAKNEFDLKYNPLEHAQYMMSDLEHLINEKCE